MDNERENRLLTSVEALTDIDDALLSEALGAKKRPSPLLYVAAAAAVLLVLGGAFAAIRLTTKPKPADISAMNPTDAPSFTPIPAETTIGPQATVEPEETDAPYATVEPTEPSAPQTTGEPPVSTEAPGVGTTSKPYSTGSQEPVTTHAPDATERPTPKATGTPHATAAPSQTPKATQKITPGPTAAPTGAVPTGADATGEPVCYDFPNEEAFVSAIRAAGNDSVLGGFTHYYVPGALPEGVKLKSISVLDHDVIFGYSGGYELDWLYSSDPDDYLAQIQSHYQGHWEGGLYIVETGGLRAFWKQDGQAFKASFPSGTDITVIKAFCAVKRVNV